MDKPLVYQCDQSGFYVGETYADPDQIQPGEWIIPGGCVTTPPPKVIFSKWPKWNGWKWQLVDKPQ